MKSKQERLIIGSLPMHQFGAITVDKQTYTIYPITGGHWLDTEYKLSLFFNHKAMNINLITDGSSFNDTITFQVGDFVYQGPFPRNFLTFEKESHDKAKLVEIRPDKHNPFCALNGDGKINKLDPALESILLKTDQYFPDFLIINNLPVGARSGITDIFIFVISPTNIWRY